MVVIDSTPPAAISLRITGTVKPNDSLFSTPEAIHFGIIRSGETKERTIQVLRYDHSPILFSRTDIIFQRRVQR